MLATPMSSEASAFSDLNSNDSAPLGDDGFIPALEPVKHSAHLPVQPLRFALFQHPFPIGRIAHKHAPAFPHRQILYRAHGPVHHDTGLFCVFLAKINGAGIDITAFDHQLLRRDGILRFLPCKGEFIAGQKMPILRRKGAVEARRAVLGDHGRFDGHGAAAAHRVNEGFIRIIAGKGDDGGAEGFRNRGRYVVSAVAAA